MNKKIAALLLAAFMLISCCGCEKQGGTGGSTPGGDSSQSSSDSSSGSDSDASSDLTSDSSSGDESAGSGSVKGELGGSLIFSNNSSEDSDDDYVIEDEEEIIPSPDDAYKLNPMKGGSDKEAMALRDKILSTTDNIKVTGTTYYVSNSGNNDNDGLTPKTAFEDMSVVNSALLKPGDAVLLERGSIFRLSGTYNCVNGVTYGAYGKGNKPAVYGSTMNYAKSYFWKPSNIKNIWYINFPFNGDVGNIVFNHGEHGCEREDFIRLLEENGDFYMDSKTNNLYVYCDKGNPGEKYYSIEISTRFILFNLPSYNADNIHIDNICFKYSGNFAIRASINPKNIKVTNCEIGWIGGSLQTDGLNVYGNGIEFIGGGENLTVENCWIYQIFDSAMTFQGSHNDKKYDMFYKNIRFKNNLMEYCGMAGIEWWAITGNTEHIDPTIIEDILFEGNITRFTGYGWVKNAVRGARHIQGPWGRYTYSNMRNFVIRNNIFDCALGGAYSYPFNANQAPTDDKHLMVGNTYYQIPTPNGIVNRYGDSETKANNQAEYEADIKRMEKNPKLIKWLG